LSIREANTEEETRYFGAEIARGLDHLLERGLIHCDLKPENIFFAPGMRARIGDLGLAERFNSKSQTGARVGTDGFRAPEVVDLRPHTYALDIFSLGCMIYLMLQGEEAWLTEG
ncbi:MAG: kinase-like domain-containing protein, partial [Linnemannia elongata]